jgi:Domain of unknown function (DUF4432)
MFNDGDLPGWSFDTSTSDLSPIAARPQLPPSWTPSAVPRQVLAACCFLKEESGLIPKRRKASVWGQVQCLTMSALTWMAASTSDLSPIAGCPQLLDPILGRGARFVAPVKKVAPRDLRATEGEMANWDSYTGPHGAGYSEEVYLMELFADEAGMTQALLKSADGARGALVSINVRELPFMTLWKNAASPQAGYVTGLEPSTSFPLPKPIERVAGRIPKLKGRESYRTKVTFTGLVSGEEVESAEGSIGELQRADPEIQISPFKATSRVVLPENAFPNRRWL